MRVLLMRLDAPLLAFGGTVVDSRNVTDELPTRSMLTGLFANALGFDRREVDRLARLQARLSVGARRDREGDRVIDYQTVDLGQDFLREGWTTDGRAEGREGGSAATGTHIRHRHYLADTVITVAVGLSSESESPTLDELLSALEEPVRPLYFGRKCCLPSEPLAVGIVEAASLLDALVSAPLSRRGNTRRLLARVPRTTPSHPSFVASERALTEERDWANQIHVGRSVVLEGVLALAEPEASS